MIQTNFYIHKKHGSYGDVLAAVGLAEMLRILTNDEKVTILDQASHFVILVEAEIDIEHLQYVTLHKNPGFHYVKLKEDDADAPPDAYPYEQEQALYRAEREQKKRSRQQVEILLGDEEVVNKASEDYLLFQSLRELQAIGASNSMYTNLRNSNYEAFYQTVSNRLKGYMSLVQTRRKNKDLLGLKTSAVQAFNPVIGKGVNRPKANSVAVNSLPISFIDWFEEWLKYIGAGLVLNAYRIGDDLKFSAIVPRNIQVNRIREKLLPSFLKMRHWGAIRVDVIVTLELIKFLVSHSEDFIQQIQQMKGGSSYTPRDIISGLSTVYFKSLGSGRALINNSFIEMPDWFPIVNREDANLWFNMIEDHQKVIQSLQEDKNEEYALLVLYRDFLSGSDWNRFLRYLAGYGILYMQRKEKSKYPPPQHSLENLKGVLSRVSTLYAEIMNNIGFEEIAKAIREATIREQYQKSKGNQRFKIHYGLFQELKRKAQFRDQVIGTLSSFINEYNTETSRKMETQGDKYKGRQLVSTNALKTFVKMYDDHPKESESIILLLIAYASSFDNSFISKEGE